jgi:hypothetical protein
MEITNPFVFVLAYSALSLPSTEIPLQMISRGAYTTLPHLTQLSPWVRFGGQVSLFPYSFLKKENLGG